ncbi:MAG TPA: helix-turn-helix transcriptional regulator [Nocardioides sp.]|nr:helix-turn-helix transcriptional regulator [Nocardioides sp.]
MAFSERLRAAIAERGVSLVWLHERLKDTGNPVSVATLSYWRSGRRNPEGASSLAALEAIEVLLGLPRGDLTDSLGATRRLGPQPPAVSPLEGIDAVARLAVEETLEELGEPMAARPRDLSTQIVAQVGREGSVVSRATRTIVQATTGVVERLAWFEIASEPTDLRPLVRDVAGGELGRFLAHAGGRVFGYTLELERSVQAPGTAVVEWTVELPAGFPTACRVSHWAPRPAANALIWVRFDPECLPTWCEEMTDGHRLQALTPSPGHAVFSERARLAPGGLHVQWGF